MTAALRIEMNVIIYVPKIEEEADSTCIFEYNLGVKQPPYHGNGAAA